MHLDPEETENSNTVVLMFINQSASDIRRKLQKLGEKALMDLMEVTEQVYHSKETKDEKKIKTGKILNRDLAKVLMANNVPDLTVRKHQLQCIAKETDRA